MATRTWETEAFAFTDPRTGATLRQLTDHRCHSHHLYFTNSGWFDEGKRLLFGSDRGGRTNLFSVELESGTITQHTDADMSRAGAFQTASVNPTCGEAYFWRWQELIAIDLHSGAERVLHRLDERYRGGITNVTADGTYVCTAIDPVPSSGAQKGAWDYPSLKDRHAAYPDCRILAAPIDGGTVREVWQQEYLLGHVNTSPKLPHLLTFCHEGPWNEVDHRIWGLDLKTGKAWPIRRRTVPRERIGHEYWHADGVHIGYHGTRAPDPDAPAMQGGQQSFFGHIRHDSDTFLEGSTHHRTGHVHSIGFDLVVGDGQGDSDRSLRLWRRAGEAYEGPRVLCEHRGTANVQLLHVHPRFSPDGRTIVFTSDRSGYGQVYEVAVPEWESLPPLG